MRYLGFAALAGCALVAAPVQAQMYEKITIVNSTGYTINEIYVSPVATDDWEEDVLHRNVLENGEEFEVDFRRADNTCRWDLKVTYDDGEEVYWRRLDLCENWHFELFYNNRTGETTLDAE